MTTGRARNYIALQCIGYVVDHWLWAMVVMLWIIGYGPWSLCCGSLAMGHDRYVYDVLHRVILLIFLLIFISCETFIQKLIISTAFDYVEIYFIFDTLFLFPWEYL